MCGITGFWTKGHDRPLRQTLDAMTDSLSHRGPDGRGIWIDDNRGIALGHRRLSIIDLSPSGAQPMASASERWVITYNGEIYNFAELRREIEKRDATYPFRGNSDTEVLLAAVESFGLVDALKRTNGMFAFALWDRLERRLHLVRDRLGIKPLYVGRAGRSLVFGSELSALCEHPHFQGEIDRQALADLLRLNSIGAPRCIYQGVHKLEPGTIVTYGQVDDEPHREVFWCPNDAAQRGLNAPFEGSADEAVETLEQILLKATQDRMVADVPLGAFLSGGVDSSTVVALMQRRSRRPVKTFSIGFHESEYNEATDALAVAQHLGTDHTEHYVSAADALAVIPELPRLYNEPFADSSQIPTFLVSQLARRDVTVSLSGDGGDELFAGYNRHVWAPRIAGILRRIPGLIRRATAAGLTAPEPAQVDATYERIAALLPRQMRVRLPAEKLKKLAGVLALAGPDEIYDHLRAHWESPTDILIGLSRDNPCSYDVPDGAGVSEQMMFRDLISYLPDDILTKVDRASMGVSLEARVPLLDHRVVEFAWTLPMSMKLRDGQSKWALRQVLYRHVPRHLIERPKMGFGIPIDHWLRGPLRDWAEALLEPTRLRREGFFEPQPIRRVWKEHLEEQANHQHELWNVLVFQAWLEAQ